MFVMCQLQMVKVIDQFKTFAREENCSNNSQIQMLLLESVVRIRWSAISLALFESVLLADFCYSECDVTEYGFSW